MKKNGFTLSELLGVIVILGVISLITFPLVLNTLSESKEKAYLVQINQIKTAAKDYIIKNPSLSMNNDESFTIYIGELKRAGLLAVDLVNSKTNKSISNQSEILVTKENNNYTYVVNIIDLEENSSQNENAPIITINGSYIEYAEINSIYTDLGASAKTINNISTAVDTQIKLDNNIVGSISTSSKKTYKIIYSATDNGLTSTSIRTVIVRDTIGPVITLPSDTELAVSEVNGFDPLTGVTAIDNSNESIIVTAQSSIGSLPGKYTVIYYASDSSGNNTEIRQVFTVVDN